MAEFEGNMQEQMQSIERLYKRATAAVPELPLLIHVPRKKLISQVLLYWVWLFFSALFSVNVLWMLTGVSFVYVFEKLYQFSKVWKVYGYSRLILWIPCVIFIITGFSNTLRSFIFDGIRRIFNI